ncbi:hypothetical protein N1028_05860 [Herbiconiux sp. CPCC 203407]|uniref:DUF3137 domain-containing protein n=1 Tax=Herbiconiux oxytropis TaxID=2970915 RepID=A0AA41XCC0_9MICO|nr:hypothetical protein [Herbiconiux oxytropis]MCS5725417.1 hypothetical protein [Herbiconiux oxytropis]
MAVQTVDEAVYSGGMRLGDTSRVLDTGPLTDEIDRRELAQYRRTLPPQVRLTFSTVFGPLLVLIVALALGAVFGGAVIGSLLAAAGSGGDPFAVAAALVFIVVPCGLVVVALRSLFRRNGRRQFRLARFAAANGLSYRPVAGALLLPGVIFSVGSDRSATDLLQDDERGIQVGNITYVTGSGKNRRTKRWGFAGIRLGTPLPHIVLDARSNNTALFGASNLPAPFDKEQRLGLEGDFDSHFTLYCPKGYEADALYLFTPDVMARFIDSVAQFDVEIVDDHLFLYSSQDLATLDPQVWQWLHATLGALADKVDRWERWRDSRLGSTEVVPGRGGAPSEIRRPPRGVSTTGRRLTQKVHWIWLVIGAVSVAFTFFWLIEGVFSALFTR